MKKTIAAFLAMASAAVFAGAGDLVVMFSTPGPDYYADGNQVLVGERYALVWTATDGTKTPVLVYPGATAEGNCSPVLFVVDENDASNYKGGTWGVYLLDTRDYESDATGSTLKKDNVTVDDVNVMAPVASGIANASSMQTVTASSSISADSYDIPQPTVTGIRVEGANVFVTVKDVVPCLEYTLKSGSDAKTFAVPEGVAKDSSSTVKEITLTVPKQDGAQFFKVTTK